MEQKYLSAETCINGRQGKLPALYSHLNFTPGITIFDYGCGEITDLIEDKMKKNDINWIGYDLNWHPNTLDQLHNGVEVAVACNLLNVIAEDEIIKNIISDMIEHSDQSIFYIHDGDRTGVGKPTQNGDSWQRNAKRQWYEELIKSLGYTVTRATGKYIYCTKGGN